jgi:hypothetical protein
VKDNLTIIARFPSDFRFQLNETEKNELVTNCDRFKTLKHSTSNPYAFTEQGVSMLSAILKSDIAIETSIKIIREFVTMRKFVSQNNYLFQRMDLLEEKQKNTDQKVDEILNAIESKNTIIKQGVFFEGQFFDAYIFISDILKSAKKSITLIDNYIDEKTIYHIGASLKDLGNKWFAFSKLENNNFELLKRINNILGDK